jgi:predicted phosphodiesterase
VVTNSYGSATSNAAMLTIGTASSGWRFAVVGDTHVTSAPTILPEIVSAMLADGVKLVLFTGDIVEAGTGTTRSGLEAQLAAWQSAVSPLSAAGVGVYAVRGNHEDDASDSIAAWNGAFTGSRALPANGPSGEANLTYSFTYNNALFIGMDDYVNIHRVNQAWLDQQLASNALPHVFVFGHEPAFQVFHTDCLGSYPADRDAFWAALGAAHSRVYFCGHDHFFDLARVDDGDGNAGNDLYQCAVGTGGSSHFMTYNGYRGTNDGYAPTGLFHEDPYGYVLVEIDGAGKFDLHVTLNFRQRAYDSASGTYSYVATPDSVSYRAVSAPGYPIVDTGQARCYSATAEVAAPAAGQPFYGQDAQISGNQPGYLLSADGLTVYDKVTGLTWQRSPDTSGNGVIEYADKLTYSQALLRPAAMNGLKYGGYNDWRLPTIRELYSLILFSGVDVASLSDTTGAIPFIDTGYFGFAYGFTSSGERTIDSQWATTTLYVANPSVMFGVNFADGRIKSYPDTDATGKKFCVICVRGNTSYGTNSFTNNGDGTVTDDATGLMWTQADSASGMNWENALAWVQARNDASYLGYGDWRLPNAKELHSILDYTRSPDTTNSPAINPVFSCTQITNEAGQADYPWYWTGTTHASAASVKEGVYFCFGRALGYMNGKWADVHGAGAQRGDPKTGSLGDYSYAPYGYYSPLAPQGDAVRISNYVRLVRTAGPGATYCPTDLNKDGRTDAADMMLFVSCATGPAIPVTDASCRPADWDGDGDVDQDDFSVLQVRLGSSGLSCN